MIDNIITKLYYIYLNSNINNGLNNTTDEYNKIRNILNNYSSNFLFHQKSILYDIYTDIDKIITNPIYLNNELLFNEHIKSKLILLNSNNLKELFTIINDNNNNYCKYTNNKKKKIPAVIKKIVWNTYIGENIGKSKCLCCKNIDITQLSFICGHYISEYNGGKITIENLRPICSMCNLSMGTTNMDIFISKFFSI